ncbi:MAG: hypothetical protein R2744_10600 [Bacteroidales bacterium]
MQEPKENKPGAASAIPTVPDKNFRMDTSCSKTLEEGINEGIEVAAVVANNVPNATGSGC